jgi:hypothetical protein
MHKQGPHAWHRRKVDPEEEAAERGSSGDDEFYDRTEDGRRRRAKEGAAALDAAQLYGRKVRSRLVSLFQGILGR